MNAHVLSLSELRGFLLQFILASLVILVSIDNSSYISRKYPCYLTLFVIYIPKVFLYGYQHV